MLACLSTDQILAIAAIGVLIVYVFIWWYTRKMAKASIEASRVQATLAFFTVYEKIITRHQREVQQTWLARVIEEMRSGVLLKRIDGTEPKIGSAGSRTYDQAIGSITAVSYYFNDIGAQLKGVWEDLPESLKTSIFKTLSGI